MTFKSPLANAAKTFTNADATTRAALVRREAEFLIAACDELAPLRGLKLGGRGDRTLKFKVTTDAYHGDACSGWARYSGVKGTTEIAPHTRKGWRRVRDYTDAYPIGVSFKIGRRCTAGRAAELVAHELTHLVTMGEHHNKTYRAALGRVIEQGYGLVLNPFCVRKVYEADNVMARLMEIAFQVGSAPQTRPAPTPRPSTRPAPVKRSTDGLRGAERLFAVLTREPMTVTRVAARAGCSTTYAAKTLPKLVADGRAIVLHVAYGSRTRPTYCLA